MKKQNQIFYIVQGSLYRNLEKSNKETIEIYRIFKSANSYTDRLNAFRYYQSFIDVLLESNLKMYKDHFQAQNDLANFYNSGIIEDHLKIPTAIDTDFGKMLSISFCTLEETPYITKRGDVYYDFQRIIHGIGYKSDLLTKEFQRSLAVESYLYNKYEIMKGEEVPIAKTFLTSASKTMYFNKFSNKLDDLLNKWYHKIVYQNYEDALLLSEIKKEYESLIMSSFPKDEWQEYFKNRNFYLQEYRYLQIEKEAFGYFLKQDEVKVMKTPLFE